eukprot:Nitzschia sp. Nitz4//scaffold22_size323478//222427//224396//NITZ4_000563-RA/size323478-augustus-gene-0.209-mRNA-1//1//CDS//3329543103//2853//frame0
MFSSTKLSIATTRALAQRTKHALSSAPNAIGRSFTSTCFVTDGALADACELRVLHSPYPPLDEKQLDIPVPEFVMSNWKAKGGDLGEQVAITDGTTGMTRTYDDYYNTSCGLAASLKYDLGVEEKDSVCLFAPNHVDYLPITLAVGLTGAKLTPVNPMYTKGELTSILNRSRSTVLIAHMGILETALEAAKASDHVKHVLVLTEDGQASPIEGVSTLDSVRSHSQAFNTTFTETHPELKHHPYILPYSSGTTGLPKGVCLTHPNMVSNMLQTSLTDWDKFKKGDTVISPLPFFHIYGMLVSNLYSAWKGTPVVTFSGRFDLQLFCEMVQEHKPKRAHLVPPIILGLGKHPMIDNYDFSSLDFIVCGAAPLALETELAASNRLGCNIKQAWGMSELSPIGTCNPDDNYKPSSVGPVVASSYAKVVDEEGNSLGPHEDGELCIKGPQVMMGYLDDPENTAACLSPTGWLRTGDVAYYDEDGYFFITDRKKELIKVKGFQVAPAEMEALLLTNDKIIDAAVIQIPDEMAGELPRAYVVLRDQSQATEETRKEIYDWVKEQVVHYKRLDGGIEFVEAIPKSASGKILRRELRDALKEEMAKNASMLD